MGLAQLAGSGELGVIAAGAVLPISKAGPGPLLDHAAGAVLESDPSGERSLAAAAAKARGEVPGATLAVMVTGTVLTDRELRRIAWFLPREASAIAVRCRQGADIAVSRVGRLGLATIGSLDHLPRALFRLGLQ
jgi:L-aminopeptidase/D-esterase-like protein